MVAEESKEACWYWIAMHPARPLAFTVSIAADQRKAQQTSLGQAVSCDFPIKEGGTHPFVMAVFRTEEEAVRSAERYKKIKFKTHEELIETKVVNIHNGPRMQMRILVMGLGCMFAKGRHETAEGVKQIVGRVMSEIPVTCELEPGFANYAHTTSKATWKCVNDWLLAMGHTPGSLTDTADPYNLEVWVALAMKARDEDLAEDAEDDDDDNADDDVNPRLDPTAEKPTQWPSRNRRPWENLFATYCQRADWRTQFSQDVLLCAASPGRADLKLPEYVRKLLLDTYRDDGAADYQATVDRHVRHAHAALNFVAAGKVILEPTPELAESLMHTRLSVPLRYVGAPFHTVYIDVSALSPVLVRRLEDRPTTYLLGTYASVFTAKWWCPDGRLYRSDSGFLIARDEGPHLQDQIGKTLEELGVQNVLVISAIYAAPGGVSHHAILLPVFMGDDLIEDAMAKSVNTLELVTRGGLSTGAEEVLSKATREAHIKCARLVCGLFLYMSNPELKLNVRPAMYGRHDEAVRGFAKGKITPAGEALLRGRKGSILKIGATASMQRNAARQSELTGKSVRAHWRAGHWHLYWTGPGRTVPVVKLLEAVLVNAKQLGVGQEVKPSNYKVK